MAFKYELLKYKHINNSNNKKDGTILGYMNGGNNIKKKDIKKNKFDRLLVFKHTYEMRFDGDNAELLRNYFNIYKEKLSVCFVKDKIMLAMKGKRKIRQLL